MEIASMVATRSWTLTPSRGPSQVWGNRKTPTPSRGYELRGTSCARGLHGSAAKPAKNIEGVEPHPIPLHTIWERGPQGRVPDPLINVYSGFEGKFLGSRGDFPL